ncbi:MAG: VOC family protein [Desulfuromusa sp.]|jgi:hypothetical protein|nr:VOC family protein [Desulfuromusa sp.]
MKTQIDHLVIGAETLSQGIEYVKDCLEVDMPYGGVHEKMGTHNHLMKIGDGIFLEVIAINPDIDAPKRPRWFGLDDPFVRQQLATQPTLLTWVVNTVHLDKIIQQAVFPLGDSELILRGDLSWNFGLPEDGRLIAGGILPYAIEWHTSNHPATNMADLKCSFHSLEIYHPYPEWLLSALASIGARDLVKIIELPKNGSPYITASINTPSGLKKIYSCGAVNKDN